MPYEDESSTAFQGRAAARKAAKSSRRKKPPRGKRIAKYTAFGTAGVLVLGAGGAYAYVSYLNSNIRTSHFAGDHKLPPPKTDANGHSALNILLIGTDTRDKPEDCALGGSCADSGPGNADVEIILHVSADRSNASMLSIPRDTDMEIPACTAVNGTKYTPIHYIINSSFGRGGAGCTEAAVEALTGISITDTMTIDFSGVVAMAGAVGGVPVCLNQNIDDNYVYTDKTGRHDEGSHLILAAGKHIVLNSLQSLEWLRTRHAFAPDGSDIGRADAQHMYLNSLIRTLRSNGTVTDPGKMLSLANSAIKSIVFSDNLKSVPKLIGLADQLKGVKTDRIESVTMPYVADPKNPTAWLVPEPGAAQHLFSMIANDIPLTTEPTAASSASASANPSTAPSASASPSASRSATPPPAKGSFPVTVVNASAGQFDNRASGMVASLKALGFTGSKTGSSPATAAKTSTLTYPAALQAQAAEVATALHLTAAAVKQSADATGITLDIGLDWPSGADFRTTLPKQGSVPKDSHAKNADDNSGCMNVMPNYQWKGSTPPSQPKL
ncbi:LCP family protein [Streptacidiphilus carbonis]|uniref:LCP family protein n=1 Tax=Streptacidiphilus carbonis TaxID=105422 RepID=UPI0005AB7331|nr:LCP family protein [Streptacidiphilus carbonis]